MSDVGLTHVALAVRSLEDSVAFYGKYAGMHAVHRRHGVVWLADGTRPFAVVLLEARDAVRPVLPPAHLGVGVASRAQVDALCELAARDGCLLRPAEDSGPPVGYWALIRDPDGHTLEIAHGQDVGLAVTDRP
jgi:lactoylglutathione lyase